MYNIPMCRLILQNNPKKYNPRHKIGILQQTLSSLSSCITKISSRKITFILFSLFIFGK